MMSPRITMTVPIAEIGELDASLYVGLIDETAVECLTVRFAAEGQKAPIWLRKNGNAAKTRWSVIAGRHRFRAAIRLGWTQIEGEERAGATSGADELRRLQIAENLDRRDLRPIERSLAIMCRWHDVARSRGWDIVSHARDADGAAGEACGVDSRTIRRYRRLHDTLVIPFPDLIGKLNAHPLGESLSAMSRLATIKHADARRKGAEAVLSRIDWKSIDDALLSVGLAADKGSRIDPKHPDDVRFFNGWAKMATPRKCSNFLRMADDIPPAFVRDVIDALSRKLP